MMRELCQDKRKKYIVILLLTGSFFAALKCILVSLQMDEEYAMSMSYRLLLGDRLFTQVWDPHQTSAFLMEFFMWLYLKLFHTTTYLVIWVRAAGVLIQFGIAYYLYRMVCHILEPEYSFYLALIYFNLLPKTYVMPEFSNMMTWGLTMLLLSLFRLAVLEGRISSRRKERPEGVIGEGKESGIDPADEENGRGDRRRKRKITFAIIEAGIWLSFTVLSYPTCLLLFPFLIWYFWKYDADRKRTVTIFTGTCFAAGALYMAYLFSYMNLTELLDNIQSLIASCGSHSAGIGEKCRIYGLDLARLILFSLGYLLVAVVVHGVVNRKSWREGRKRQCEQKKGRKFFSEGNFFSYIYVLLVMSFVLQFLHWIFMLWEYEYSYPYTVYFFLFAIAFYCLKKLSDEKKEIAVLWLGANTVMYIAILLLTNLTLFTSVKYLTSGAIMCAAVLIIYTKDRQPEICWKYARIFLVGWCFVAVFVKGWAYTDNDGLMKNVTCVGNIISVGPGKGIFTEYMQGYMQECSYGEFRTYIQPGENLLVLDSATLCYLYQDVNVASSTTICTPFYDENLLDYWEWNPDKYPDVIAVQCWYGELKWDSDSWIMHWIEEEFGASQVIDGNYFRYYIRRT